MCCKSPGKKELEKKKEVSFLIDELKNFLKEVEFELNDRKRSLMIIFNLGKYNCLYIQQVIAKCSYIYFVKRSLNVISCISITFKLHKLKSQKLP